MSIATKWLDQVPADSFFAASDVPGDATAVHPLLSRLAADPQSDIARVKNGLYWKRPAAGVLGIRPNGPAPRSAGIAAAGRGAGLAGDSAVNALGWSTQVPATPSVAVVGRPPKGVRGVRFVSRSNLARLELTAAEVTLLEALRVSHANLDIDPSLIPKALRSMAAAGTVRLDRLITAAQSDRAPLARQRLAAAA